MLIVEVNGSVSALQVVCSSGWCQVNMEGSKAGFGCNPEICVTFYDFRNVEQAACKSYVNRKSLQHHNM